ncbi:MAG: radical SAM protein [Oscillospiraceae bacterium]|nr:radical SAM protein [Oscillospiraceae bacterium]
MNVSEIFTGINGEGPLAGTIAVFIRLTGCNLDCVYCDTRYAQVCGAGKDYTLPEILERIDPDIKHITVTGGEPLIHSGIGELLAALADSGKIVSVETNGTVCPSSVLDMSQQSRPSFIMDYKLPSSGQEKSMDINNFLCLTEKDAVKFVAGDHGDLERMAHVYRELSGRIRTQFLAGGVFGGIPASDIVRFLIENKLYDIRFQLQLHKCIWGSDKKGV